jgi:putative transposase
MARRKAPAIPDEMLDRLLSGASASTAFDQGGLLDQLKKALAERALNAEMDHHLAGEGGARNSRNGYGRKSVVTDTGRIALEIPRDRQGSFDPVLIAKYQRRFPGFDEKIVSMYAHGMSTREIAGHLEELYGIEVSPDLVSTVTDAVLEEIVTWQARPLEPVYPLVFFDALRVKIRDEGLVRNKAVHIALGVRADGTKENLGNLSGPARQVRLHIRPGAEAMTGDRDALAVADAALVVALGVRPERRTGRGRKPQ